MDDITLECKAGLPKFYRSEKDKGMKLDAMADSQFHGLMSVPVKNASMPLFWALLQQYDVDTNSFSIGSHRLVLCADEVAFLLGIKNSGETFVEDSSKATIMDEFYAELCKTHLDTQQNGHPLRKTSIESVLEQMDVDDEKSKNYFQRLMRFYLINFIFIPPRDLDARNRYFKHIDKAEDINWAQYIVKNMTSNIVRLLAQVEDYRKNKEQQQGKVKVMGKGKGKAKAKAKTEKRKFFVPFFTQLLEAWFYSRTKKAKNDSGNSNAAPMSLCLLSENLRYDSALKTVKEVTEVTNCRYCEDKVKELTTNSPSPVEEHECKILPNYEQENELLEIELLEIETFFSLLTSEEGKCLNNLKELRAEQILKYCWHRIENYVENLGLGPGYESYKDVLGGMKKVLCGNEQASNRTLMKALSRPLEFSRNKDAMVVQESDSVVERPEEKPRNKDAIVVQESDSAVELFNSDTDSKRPASPDNIPLDRGESIDLKRPHSPDNIPLNQGKRIIKAKYAVDEDEEMHKDEEVDEQTEDDHGPQTDYQNELHKDEEMGEQDDQEGEEKLQESQEPSKESRMKIINSQVKSSGSCADVVHEDEDMGKNLAGCLYEMHKDEEVDEQTEDEHGPQTEYQSREDEEEMAKCVHELRNDEEISEEAEHVHELHKDAETSAKNDNMHELHKEEEMSEHADDVHEPPIVHQSPQNEVRDQSQPNEAKDRSRQNELHKDEVMGEQAQDVLQNEVGDQIEKVVQALLSLSTPMLTFPDT